MYFVTGFQELRVVQIFEGKPTSARLIVNMGKVFALLQQKILQSFPSNATCQRMLTSFDRVPTI